MQFQLLEKLISANKHLPDEAEKEARALSTLFVIYLFRKKRGKIEALKEFIQEPEQFNFMLKTWLCLEKMTESEVSELAIVSLQEL